MTSILGWTRLLALGGLDEKTQREALDALERSTLAQAKLIEDLLDESRIASGKLRLEIRPVSLRTIADTAVSQARPSANARRITLSVEQQTECDVAGDPSRLQQAVGNLLSNAIKFTPEDGRVIVRVRCDEAWGIVEVSDSGPGVEASLLPHLFDRFTQGTRQSVDRHSGLGLGLSITRHVVEMHGGSVDVTSRREGSGATFTIRLPLHHEATGDRLTDRDAAGRARSMPKLEGIHFLIIEDDADNGRVLATALKQCGADVECVTSGRAAFDVVARWHPDVIVSDIALPDMDGCDLLGRMRSGDGGATSLAPALALTVLGRPDEQQRILAAGFDVFRQKPIDPIDLAHETARLAGRG